MASPRRCNLDREASGSAESPTDEMTDSRDDTTDERADAERLRGKSGPARRGSGGKDRPKPTPVRHMTAVEAPPPPVEPDLEQAELTAGEQDWIVRVAGRAGGAEASATPLLLLGFWRAESSDGERQREALVVGRALAELTPAALAEAFAESRPPPEPEGPASDDARRRHPERRPRGRSRGGGRRRGR